MTLPAAEMPPLGLGTSPGRSSRPIDLSRALDSALDAGYRLFDTAEAYGVEPLLGQALASASIERPELYLVSKVWQTNHGFDDVLGACRASLARLGTEYLDLYLIHAPVAWRHLGPLRVEPGWSFDEIAAHVVPRDAHGEIEASCVPIEETWQAMLELRRTGLARAVGVANFDLPRLEALRAAGFEPPAVVQVELHPLKPHEELLAYCRSRGIRVMAHSPLGSGRLLSHARVTKLARELGRSPAQLILAWHLARGTVPVPASHRPEHVRENLGAVGISLAPDALAALDALGTAATGSA